MTEVLVGTKKGLFVLEGEPGAGYEVTARAFAKQRSVYGRSSWPVTRTAMSSTTSNSP